MKLRSSVTVATKLTKRKNGKTTLYCDVSASQVKKAQALDQLTKTNKLRRLAMIGLAAMKDHDDFDNIDRVRVRFMGVKSEGNVVRRCVLAARTMLRSPMGITHFPRNYRKSNSRWVEWDL